MMESQKIKKSVGGKLFKQFSVRDGEIPMVGKKLKVVNNFLINKHKRILLYLMQIHELNIVRIFVF